MYECGLERVKIAGSMDYTGPPHSPIEQVLHGSPLVRPAAWDVPCLTKLALSFTGKTVNVMHVDRDFAGLRSRPRKLDGAFEELHELHIAMS